MNHEQDRITNSTTNKGNKSEMTEFADRLLEVLDMVDIEIYDRDLLIYTANHYYDRLGDLFEEFHPLDLDSVPNSFIGGMILDLTLGYDWKKLKEVIPDFLQRVLGVQVDYLGEAARLQLFLFMIGQVRWLSRRNFTEETCANRVMWLHMPPLIRELQRAPLNEYQIDEMLAVNLLLEWPRWITNQVPSIPQRSKQQAVVDHLRARSSRS